MNTTRHYNRPKAIAAIALVLLLAVSSLAFILLRQSPADVQEQDTTSTTATDKGGLAAADRNGDGIVYQSGMHPWIVEDAPGKCPICGMDLMPVRVDGTEEGTVKIDPVMLQNIGVRTAPVVVAPLQRTVRTTGRFEANEQLTAAVSPKISGWVEKLHVNYEGARVAKGQPLLEIYSPELVSTQEEYLLAYRNAERLQGGTAREDAQRLVDAARRRLAYWDITEEQIRHLEAQGTPQKTLTLYAPASGIVVGKNVTEGQRIMAGQMLMELADLSQLWLMIDVYEQDLAWVKEGTAAEVSLPYDPGRTLTGKVSFIYNHLALETRTVQARVQVPNPGLELKPEMYATVTLRGAQTEPLPVVPAEAIVRTGDREVVILALGEGRFMPTQVEIGVEADGRVQILQGLTGDEEVVTSAQFLIDSEARLASAVSAMMTGHNHGSASARAGQDEATGPRDVETPSTRAEKHGEAQVVQIDITGAAFDPAQIQLKKGVPARLLFTRHTEKTCATDVMIPALGVETTPLPMHEQVVIEVLPKEDGAFTFACGMDMLKGTLVVTS